MSGLTSVAQTEDLTERQEFEEGTRLEPVTGLS